MDAHKQSEMLERLRVHLSSETTDLSPYALKVPAEHYVSEDQLALEVEVLFKQRPVLVADRHIANEGDYLTHEVIDTSLLLVRDTSGVARAYINACRHREAHVWPRVRGTKASFSCPFHAWNWDWMVASLPALTVTTDSLRQMLVMNSCLK